VSWDEWEQTAQWLMSWDRDSVLRGINRVTSWRCRGRVPLGAEITASLLEVILQDHGWPHGLHDSTTHGAYHTAEMSTRLAYSMTLVRFVNGVVDSGQKGQSASSVSKLADTYGLPRVLVDIRHESTHNKLPSLPMLRAAVQHALSWLEYNYWEGQRRYLAANVNKIRTVLHDYHELYRIRRTSSREQLTEGSAGEGSPGPGSFKQQRRRALAELKDSFPAPAAELLIGPLLEVMTHSTSSSEDEALTPTLTPSLRAEEFEALSKEWQHLPTLVFNRVVQDACSAMRHMDWIVAKSHAQLAIELLDLILGSMANKRRGSAQGSGQASPEWLDGQGLGLQLVELAQAYSDANGLQRGGDAALTEDSPDFGLFTVWEKLIQGIAQVATPESVGHHALSLLRAAAGEKGKAATKAMVLDSDAVEAERREREKVLVQMRAGSCGEGAATGRWEVERDWIPCAVGCLPSRSAPNGILPLLVAPPERASPPEEEDAQQMDCAAAGVDVGGQLPRDTTAGGTAGTRHGSQAADLMDDGAMLNECGAEDAMGGSAVGYASRDSDDDAPVASPPRLPASFAACAIASEQIGLM